MGVGAAVGQVARTTRRHYRALLTALLMPLLPGLLLGALTAAALTAHGAITSGQAPVWSSLPLLTQVFAAAGALALLAGVPIAVCAALRVAADAVRGRAPDLGRAWRPRLPRLRWPLRLPALGVVPALLGLVPLFPALPVARIDPALGLLWVLVVAPWTAVALCTRMSAEPVAPGPRAPHPVPAPLLAALLATTPFITPGPLWFAYWA
ncbi:hypothetical protein IDM40_06490 [Nocardiopsis sp. HNM0947]|uniref:Uncharacterized protein n=1 Tax=Nocardiopsis coralli TaxID=2772213 RepID=A0ABR9P3N6_9ACTN|nr:hypothetical protein [Nocardiopsis coralli]MBE2998355.1 hypothetical protein [Nocardiopsis coralli]